MSGRRQTIIAWGASHAGTVDGLETAFEQLAAEGLFVRVIYTIFAAPMYSCSYEDRFLDELPPCLTLSGVGGDYLREQWEMVRSENDETFGEVWRHCGECWGQGRQNMSPEGVCLGPGCQWFLDGEPSCYWNLPFAGVPRTGWPDMSALKNCGDKPSVELLRQVLAMFQPNAEPR